MRGPSALIERIHHKPTRERAHLLSLAAGAPSNIHNLADVERYFSAAAHAGFRGVTLGLHQLCGDSRSVRRLLDVYGLECDDLASLRVTRDEEVTMTAAAQYSEAVQELNPKGITTLFWTTVNEQSLDRLGRIADRLETTMLIEFSPGPVATIEDAVAVVSHIGTNRAQILLDSFHFFRSGSTWQMLESLSLEHIAIVQFDDALPSTGYDYMHETTTRRTWPGSGEFPLKRFSHTLRKKGWNGPISVEVLSNQFTELSLDDFCQTAFSSSIAYWS